MAKRAKADRKMIVLKVQFWTDNIQRAGGILPGHAWTSGTVRSETNSSHGIKPGGNAIFNSLLELPLAVERVLIQQGIQLHPNRRDRKYLSPRP